MSGPALARRSAAAARERRRIEVRGTVQGVGFRPFVYRTAVAAGLRGWVRNTSGGVEIEVEGEPAALDAWTARLRADAPALARIQAVEARPAPLAGETAFRILPSRLRAGEWLPVCPDAGTCSDCLAELLDPADRRHGYAFTNCTACGPRFTIIDSLPYDRARTSMCGFPLCDACRAEYEDPSDRRFHAEPVACPACGPKLLFVDAATRRRGGGAEAGLEGALTVLRGGGIVAIKGLGGFQLACDARSESAVARLRERKSRDAKPFAVMVRDLEAARALCDVDAAEAAALAGPRAPIVLLRRRPDTVAALASAVAPGLETFGLMLPYTPLHHLLLRSVGGPLVMTSGNRSDEPIAAANEEAVTRLAEIADGLLLHDRPIVSRYDDSVVRIDAGGESVLRRARGYAPEPIRLPRPAPVPILALGPQLKNSFCLVRGELAFVSQHIGDLDDAATLAHFHDTLARYRRLFGIEPAVAAHDLHPDYATTRVAAALDGVRVVGVQHHHAHVASCLAEHGLEGPALGLAFDGTGYGEDGAVWGGELLLADWRGFRRLTHLRYLPLPGGDAAAREPWRMALAALAAAYGDEADELAAELLGRIPPTRRRAVLGLAPRGTHAPPTSSMGRLFDAVAALAGVRHENRYEGQAAMELEALVEAAEAAAYPLPFEAATRDGDAATWDPRPLVRAVVEDVRRGESAGRIAGRFHNALIRAAAEACGMARADTGVDVVALSGGCFQNARLARGVRVALEAEGFRVVSQRRVPPNDGGISLGQAAVALAALD